VALLLVALMSTPTQKFVLLPHWYYRLYKIENYDFRVVPNGITSTLNFIQIHPAVLDLNHAGRQTDGRTDRQTRPALYAFISCTSCKERIICKTTEFKFEIERKVQAVVNTIPILLFITSEMNNEILSKLFSECIKIPIPMCYLWNCISVWNLLANMSSLQWNKTYLILGIIFMKRMDVSVLVSMSHTVERISIKLSIIGVQCKLQDKFYGINKGNFWTNLQIKSLLHVDYSVSFLWFITRTLFSVQKGGTVI
jgi:hypothetical protein